MDYFIYRIDKNNYTYSIDNVVLEYIIKTHKDIIQFLRDLSEKYNLSNEYWERLNVPYCSKYQFYNNHIHLCDGIYIMIGKYDTYSDLSSSHNVFPILKIEINPNKHAYKPIFNSLMKFIKSNTGDCTLKKYDFCIDIECKLSDIEVFGSKKEPGLYKGTRYFGQRNKDGYLKIYDKGKEQKLEKDLTRIEYTLVYTKGQKSKQGLNLQDICIIDPERVQEDTSGTNKCIIKLINICKSNGLNYQNALDELDRRKRKDITELLSGYKYNKIDIDLNLHESMIKELKNLFGVVEQKQIFTDKDGFLVSPDGFDDIPFD